MTPQETFIYERQAIVAALQYAGINAILLNKDDQPGDLPAAIVALNTETGKGGTSKRFTATDLEFSVYIVVNAHQVRDPDADLYRYKEAFRAAYRETMGRDIPKVSYYTARYDGARLVRVAQIDLLRVGSGTAS